MIKRIIAWYRKQTPEAKIMIFMIPLLLLAILLNWNRVWKGISKGFSWTRANAFSGNDTEWLMVDG